MVFEKVECDICTIVQVFFLVLSEDPRGLEKIYTRQITIRLTRPTSVKEFALDKHLTFHSKLSGYHIQPYQWSPPYLVQYVGVYLRHLGDERNMVVGGIFVVLLLPQFPSATGGQVRTNIFFLEFFCCHRAQTFSSSWSRCVCHLFSVYLITILFVLGFMSGV